MTMLEIGRLLRANITGCVVGCRVTDLDAPSFGGMVRIPQEGGYQIIGLIHDIRIDDDGLVRQLVTTGDISDEVILDNRLNRNVPLEVSVLFIGHELEGTISHLIPPRPPLTLDRIYTCTLQEICRFTSTGRFGYFRHILRAVDLPVAELLAGHLQQADRAQNEVGDSGWLPAATQELIVLLRDDYPMLMAVLGSISDMHIPSGRRFVKGE